MRDDVPAQLTRRLTILERTIANEWWRSLPSHEREAVMVLAKPARRGLVCQFVDDPYVDDGSAADEPDDLYEWLVNHEIATVERRLFHVGTSEPEARAAVAAGWVPRTFECPRAAAGCPMRRLVGAAGGRNVRIALARSEGGDHG
jgi:hypothetical protein